MGAESFDDAGALRLRDDLILLQTADIISPISDDPYLFGQVAAANALSDVYAMGGTPVSALNLAFFPGGMPRDQQREILRGAADKCDEAGAPVVGGHTVEDREAKFGLAVSGTCRPEDLLRNTGALAGDRLVLTKPVGTGLLLTAMKKRWLREDELRACHQQMAALNDDAARQAIVVGAHAATDVTGFGLGGHAAEMARGSGARMRLRLNACRTRSSSQKSRQDERHTPWSSVRRFSSGGRPRERAATRLCVPVVRLVM